MDCIITFWNNEIKLFQTTNLKVNSFKELIELMPKETTLITFSGANNSGCRSLAMTSDYLNKIRLEWEITNDRLSKR
jgi:hypothetical protein